MFEILTGATIPFGRLIAPLGDFVTNEKKSIASGTVLVIRTLIDEGPTTEIGSVNGVLSKNPLCPGKNAGLKPARFESNCEASAPAEPMPGSAEIALGTPPIGYINAAVGVTNCNCLGSFSNGSFSLVKTLGITVESCSEIEPFDLVN